MAVVEVREDRSVAGVPGALPEYLEVKKHYNYLLNVPKKIKLMCNNQS